MTIINDISLNNVGFYFTFPIDQRKMYIYVLYVRVIFYFAHHSYGVKTHTHTHCPIIRFAHKICNIKTHVLASFYHSAAAPLLTDSELITTLPPTTTRGLLIDTFSGTVPLIIYTILNGIRRAPCAHVGYPNDHVLLNRSDSHNVITDTILLYQVDSVTANFLLLVRCWTFLFVRNTFFASPCSWIKKTIFITAYFDYV